MTILFQKDIHRHDIIIDTKTKNESFLRMSLLLKRMGIKNNKFFLALHDRELQGVDPHDPNISNAMKMKIAFECRRNIWYFLREVVRISAQGGPAIPYKLDRANLALTWLFLNRYDILLVQPRQTGKTISSLVLTAYVMYIEGYNITLSMLTKDRILRQENVSRLKDLRDSLPSWLVSKSRSDADNKEGLTYTQLKNKYLTFVAQSEVTAAYNLGRGLTSALLHFDEPSTFKNFNVSYPVAVSTTTAAAESARAHGQPCSNILTSNAGVLDTPEGKFCHNLLTSSLPFTEKLYDTENYSTLDDLLSIGSSNKMFYLTYSYLQLGKTHEWFRNVTQRISASKDTIDRDFLNIWKSGTGAEILSQDTLQAINNSKEEPRFVDITDNYIWRWYVDEHMVLNGDLIDIPMILAADSSENVGSDFTSFVLIDTRNMNTLATFRCNDSNIIKVAIHIAKFLIRYKKTLFIPERNSTGTAILDTLFVEFAKYNINPYKRIFNSVIQDMGEKDYANVDTSSTNVDGTVRKYFGFRTTTGTRKMLYVTVFNKAMTLNKDKIKDKILIDEISGLTVKNGRIDHKSGGHDDTVIAYLLACYVLFFGKNLDFYGISYDQLLSTFSESQSEEDKELQYQKDLRSQIIELEKRMNKHPSEIVRLSLYRKLKALKSRVDETCSISDSQLISHDKYAKEVVSQSTSNINTNDIVRTIGCL